MGDDNQFAIFWLKQIKEKYIHDGDEEFDSCRKRAIDIAIRELEKPNEHKPDCEHANHDGAGCLGYCGCEQDDEPIEACKQCEKYTGNMCAEY